MPIIIGLTRERCRSLAECHIACWREAYRGLVPEHMLDAFDVECRAEQCERDLASGLSRNFVAVDNRAVVGFASARAGHDRHAEITELDALYLRRSHYGSGLADRLLTNAIGAAPCALWVFEDNPRAKAFYRRHGFAQDGERRVEPFSGVIEVRMARNEPARVT